MKVLAPITLASAAQIGLAILIVNLLAACTTYAPLPLATGSRLKTTVAELRHADPLPAHLGVDDVARLAVDNNPALLAAHTRHSVGESQLLQAGILPNPILGANYGFLLGGPANTHPLAIALNQDLRSLLTQPSRRRAARASLHALDAALLWEEWQVFAKARLMTVDLIEGDRQLRVLRETVAVLASRVARSRQAQTSGDVTLTSLIPDLAAYTDLQRQLDELARRQATQQEDLAALLGLAPYAQLDLTDDVTLPAIDAAQVASQLRDIVVHRPDLLALEMGYEAQEERVRGAILAQFPVLSIGSGYERDNMDVRTVTPQITLELPVFDRNQGNIAAERATRQQLHEEFTARLIGAQSEALALLADQALLRRQYDDKRAQLTELVAVADHIGSAFANGNLDERSYVDALVARTTKQQELLTMEQSLLEQQVAVAALVGAGMPKVSFIEEQRP
jgi:outer membrane protein TolC